LPSSTRVKTAHRACFYFVTASPTCQNGDCVDAAIFALVEPVPIQTAVGRNRSFLGDDLDLS
jgi:hypothetical protein